MTFYLYGDAPRDDLNSKSVSVLLAKVDRQKPWNIPYITLEFQLKTLKILINVKIIKLKLSLTLSATNK